MMKTMLPVLASSLAAILALASPASAQLAFGLMGDPSGQSINRSFVGDLARPTAPSGIASPFGTAEANSAVTRGAAWTNLGPPCLCAALIFPRPMWAGRPGFLAPGTPLLVGPVVTAGNQDICASGAMLVVSYPVANARGPAGPLAVASAR